MSVIEVSGEAMVDDILEVDFDENVNDDLKPTEKRIMGMVSYVTSFLGGSISIGTFSLGAGLLGILTLPQAIAAIFVGCLVIAIALTIVGACGNKYGIPFTVQLRSSFGTVGVKIPGVLRGLPAIVWFGFLSWIGAGAINSCLKIMFGFDCLPVVYILFTTLQVAMSIKGFEGIKVIGNVSCVFILAVLAYMLYLVNTQFPSEIHTTFAGVKGTWGMPFWAATTSFLGVYSTMIVNASDYSRNATEDIKSVKSVVAYVLGIVPGTMFLGVIGLLMTAATGNSDPIEVFSTIVDNKVITVIVLLFLAFAQITANVLNNIVPPAYVLMESFKMKWTHATILVGILSVCVMPWRLVTGDSAAGLALFTQFYSAFLGPIFAVMAVDYHILRKKKLNMNDMYDKGGCFKGVNWAAVIAIIVGSVCSVFVMQLSWYVSLIPTGVVYYFLMKTMKSSKGFRKGTIFED